MPPVKGRMLNYTEEQMANAIRDVLAGVPCATAAKQYSVPRITLMYKVKGKTPIYRRMGPDTVLSKDEESLLAEWVVRVAKAGFPVTRTQLLDSVQHLINELRRDNPFKDNRPGRTWFMAFLKRNPNISIRVAQNLTSSRAAVRKETLLKWFQEIKEYLNENNYLKILEDPTRVFNLDESAFFLNPKGNKVLALKGEKSIYQQINSDEKECLTVLITGNANGDLAPPLVVFKYERIPHDVASSVPGHWGIGKSESGWMTGPLFFEFITNVFQPWVIQQKITLPVSVFIDGHSSHPTLHCSKFCDDHGIILIALFPNSTHLIQPMDVAVFRALKEGWKRKVHQWRIEHLNQPTLKKIHFSPLLQETMMEYITPEILRNGFRKCGLVPWNPEAVDFSKIPSIENENQTKGSDSPDKIKECLKVLESYIGEDKVNIFWNSLHEWDGNIEDLSLFLVWKKINDDCKEKNKENNILYENGGQSEIALLNENEREGLNNHITTDENTEEVIDDVIVVQHVTPTKEIKNLNSKEETGSVNTLQKTKDSRALETRKLITLEGKEVPSPFKRALFWPGLSKEEETKRRKSKKEKIPSVVSSKQWQLYYEKKEEAKKTKEREKQERAELRKSKKALQESIKKQKAEEKKRKPRKPAQKSQNSKKKICESSSSDSEEEWQESGDSLDDISLPDEEFLGTENEVVHFETDGEIQPKSTGTNENYKKNDFILVNFPGKKKYFKYVCIIQTVFQDGEIQVVALRATSNDKKKFQVNEQDVSVIIASQIIKVLPIPQLSGSGEPLKYEFESPINVDG